METNKNTSPVIEEKDRNAISLDLMNRMKLHGMASAFRESLNSTMAENMTIDAFLSMLLSQEWDYRSNAAIERLIRAAGFRYKAYPEQIDYTIPRGLDRNQMERLASLEFVRQARNLFITGSSGTGKSFAESGTVCIIFNKNIVATKSVNKHLLCRNMVKAEIVCIFDNTV